MNRARLLSSNNHVLRLLLAALVSLPFSGACSDDEGTPAPPVDLSLRITALDGSSPDSNEPAFRCDGLGVAVEITPAINFTLRPRLACGNSGRCGYVHVEGLNGSGDVLGSVDSVTTFGLLEIPADKLGELSRVRAVLLRGIDDDPVTNQDRSEVATEVEVSRAAPSGCEATGVGGQAGNGAGGQAGQAGQAGSSSTEAGAPSAGSGAGGAPVGGAPASDAGAGGAPVLEPVAGSGGV